MKLQHCTKAQIHTLQEERICNAEVVGNVEDGTALLWFDDESKERLSKLLETEVLVKFIDEVEGVYPCVCRLSEQQQMRETEDGEETPVRTTIQCTITAEHEVIQRRQDVKVSIHLETTASFLNENNDLETAQIVILDISAGGMFCLSEQKWPENQVFAAKIFDAVLPVDIEVLRVQTAHSYSADYAEGDPRFGYGCQFINLSQSAESALRKFVYQQQLAKRRSRRKV